MSPQAWVTLGIAIYSALLASLLAWRQVWQERRRLRVIARSLVWIPEEDVYLEVLEVRAICESRRPVYVESAGVLLADDALYTPLQLHLEPPRRGRPAAPALLNDGEGISFYFDLLSFEDERLIPKAVWVRDQADREYTKRLPRKLRRELPEHITKLRERLGPDVESQEELLRAHRDSVRNPDAD